MERSEILLGKYGEEGDRLIFRVLDNGDFMKGVDTSLPSSKIASSISKRAMRYDLTVPFARFVAQHRNDLVFPFKRYQIQPVWRADRPQKGRYQEFYQCDADVIGSESLLHEVEFVQIFDEVFARLGFTSFQVHLNNRKILAGLAEAAGYGDGLGELAIALDKLDKIGPDRVVAEWMERGMPSQAVEVLAPILHEESKRSLEHIRGLIGGTEIGSIGLEEMDDILAQLDSLGLERADVVFDITLARGLDYYTGTIFEVTTDQMAIGSLAGGGRYDDLTATFGLKDMTGVGISFGADRIYDVIEHLGLWPDNLSDAPKVLFVNFGKEEARYAQQWLKSLREAGIACELYPLQSKMKKQMKYADDRGIAYVAMAGSREMEQEVVSLKEMSSGNQQEYGLEALLGLLGIKNP